MAISSLGPDPGRLLRKTSRLWRRSMRRGMRSTCGTRRSPRCALTRLRSGGFDTAGNGAEDGRAGDFPQARRWPRRLSPSRRNMASLISWSAGRAQKRVGLVEADAARTNPQGAAGGGFDRGVMGGSRVIGVMKARPESRWNVPRNSPGIFNSVLMPPTKRRGSCRFSREHPDDQRPREAIMALRAWAGGGGGNLAWRRFASFRWIPMRPPEPPGRRAAGPKPPAAAEQAVATWSCAQSTMRQAVRDIMPPGSRRR